MANSAVIKNSFLRTMLRRLAIFCAVMVVITISAQAQVDGDTPKDDEPPVEKIPSDLSPAAREERLAAIRKRLSESRSSGYHSESLRLLREQEQLSKGTAFWTQSALTLMIAEYAAGSQTRAVQLAEELLAASGATLEQRAEAAARLLRFHANTGDRAQSARLLPVAERAFRDLPADLASWRRSRIECRLLHGKSLALGLEGDIEGRISRMREAIQTCQRYAEEVLAGSAGEVSRNMRVEVENELDVFYGGLVYALTRAGRADEAIFISREGLVAARNDNRPPEVVAAWQKNLANAALYKRDFKMALEAADACIATFAAIGVEAGSHRMAQIQRDKVLALIGLRRWAEADAAYSGHLQNIAGDSIARRRFSSTLRESMLAAKSGRAAEVVERLERLLRNRSRTYGTRHRLTIETHAVSAIVNMALGATAAAMANFDVVFDFLFDENAAWQDIDPTGTGNIYIDVALNEFLEFVAERYRQGGAAVIDERLFSRLTKVIDRVSTGSVQRAIIDSTSRFVSAQPELADLLRKEQDLRTQIRAAYGEVTTLMSQDTAKTPEEERRKVREQLKLARGKTQSLNNQLVATRKTVATRFPGYHLLVNPALSGPDDLRKVLQPGEAMISLYATQGATFAWAVNSSGHRALHISKLGEAEIAPRVNLLRRALDAGSFSSDQLPRFNFQTALELYNELIAPLRPVLQGASSLIVAADGALATIPLSVLVSAPATDYKAAAWLGKEFAVAHSPGVSALVAQRRARASSAAGALIGFGDPTFGTGASGTVAKVRTLATGERAQRSASYSAAQGFQYASIPPLPETRDELIAIAKALGANPGTDLLLGDQATRKAVLSADLASRRVVAFATHGLLPGEIPGLSKPALAMAGVSDPGESPLLTLDDVLTLKLNSDWVVLSACNTAGGERDGEALSGLVRGFFFAGTRAVLATHWAVDSEASKQLVSALFMHYAQNRGAQRSASLRQAQSDMIDGKFGAAYSHPFFWAPYAFFGDPGK
jgi:CHAT domain-containing protein